MIEQFTIRFCHVPLLDEDLSELHKSLVNSLNTNWLGFKREKVKVIDDLIIKPGNLTNTVNFTRALGKSTKGHVMYHLRAEHYLRDERVHDDKLFLYIKPKKVNDIDLLQFIANVAVDFNAYEAMIFNWVGDRLSSDKSLVQNRNYIPFINPIMYFNYSLINNAYGFKPDTFINLVKNRELLYIANDCGIAVQFSGLDITEEEYLVLNEKFAEFIPLESNAKIEASL